MSALETFLTAKAYEDRIVIPTYELKEANKNPCFENQYGISYIYPYPLLDDFSLRPVDKTYRALHIENRYLKVTVLPELGGRVYSVYDKNIKREVFYKNTVIKFAPLALRGAFFSGGIEINFPVGHAVTTTETVNWNLTENRDGSASISYGAIEHLSRMKWIVTLTLYPDRCALAQDLQIQNPSSIPGRYFYWCTPACEANDQTEFIYPFRRCRSYMWDGEISWPNARVDLTPLGGKLETYVGVPTWPYKQMHKPIDIHFEKNIINQVSIFGSNVKAEYFGAWQHAGDYGYAHYADHRDIAGMKHWSWGNSGMSLMTQTSLTDDGSRYAETQCGVMENQHDFDFLLPTNVRRWREWWLPLRGMGGLTCASAEMGACIRLIKSEQTGRVNISLTICPVREHTKLTIKLFSDERTLLEKEAAAKPEDPWRHIETLDLVNVADHPISLSVFDEQGIEILKYAQKRDIEVNNIPESVVTIQPKTADEYFKLGLSHEKLERREEAVQAYNEALSLDETHGLTHVHLGLMHFRSANFQLASEHFQKAVMAGNIEASYYQGNLLVYQGKLQEAESCYKAVPAGTPLSSAAMCGLGSISMRKSQWEEAIQFFKSAIAEDADSITAASMHAVALRVIDQKDEACDQLLEILQRDPLNHIALREMALTTPDESRQTHYKNKLGQLLADDCQFILDLACFYTQAGLLDDALSILLEGAQGWDYPMLAYLVADLFQKFGKNREAEVWFDKASAGNPDWVFPSRIEEIVVLNRVVQEKPNDTRAKYYLGNFYYSRQRDEEAIQLWEAAMDGLKSYDVIYRNLGLAYWKRRGDLKRAIGMFEAGLALNPLNQDLYIHLDDLYCAQNLRDKRRALLNKMLQLNEPRHDIQKRIVIMLVDLDLYEEAILKLSNEYFMPLEMDQSFRLSYVRAYLKKGDALLKENRIEDAIAAYKRALEYPKNVGVGRPVVGTNAEILYRLGCAYEALGRIDEAFASWQEAGGETHVQGSDLFPFIQKSLDKLNFYSELGYYK